LLGGKSQLSFQAAAGIKTGHASFQVCQGSTPL
jgi:hypothetical protein